MIILSNSLFQIFACTDQAAISKTKQDQQGSLFVAKSQTKHQSKPSQNFAKTDNLIDFSVVREKVTALVEEFGDPNSSKCRMALLALLKEVVAEGRDIAEQKLLQDGSGLKCAARLSNLQDELIGVIHEFALNYIYRVDNPSSGERMAVIAVGGCLLYTSPSPRDQRGARMPSSA